MARTQKTDTLLNVSIALLPWLLYSVAYPLLSLLHAAFLGIAAWIIWILHAHFIQKNTALRLLTRIGGIALAGFLVLSVCSLPPYLTAWLATLFFFIVLSLIQIYKLRFCRYYLRCNCSPHSTGNLGSRTVLSELLFVVRLVHTALLIYLVVTALYFLLPAHWKQVHLSTALYHYLAPLLLSLVILFEYLRIFLIRRQLKKEKWLPVCTVDGHIIGKVVQSVSLRAGNTYLHPLVRVALLYQGKLYMSSRPEHYLIQPGSTDHYLEKHLRYGETLEQALQQLLTRLGKGTGELPTRFAFKYLYHSPTTQRLVYLYTLPIHSQEVFRSLQLSAGTTFTEAQIDDNLHRGYFSDLFEKEYSMFKHTVLLAEKIKWEKAKEKQLKTNNQAVN